jgi:hypothetical protein
MGKGDQAFTWTITKAEYTMEPFSWQTSAEAGTAKTKLLVLTYTIQNPSKSVELQVDTGSAKLTVVHVDGQSYEPTAIIQSQNRQLMSISLKPGQKVEGQAMIRIPGKGDVPKLMVEHWQTGNKVLRYNLRGKVKGLPAPFADPDVKVGSDLRSSIPGTIGVEALAGLFKVTVNSVERKGTIGDYEASEDEDHLVATITVANPTRVPLDFNSSWILPKFVTEDGDKFDPTTFLTASRDAQFEGGSIEPGQTRKFRVLFLLPKDLKIGKLTITSYGTGNDESVTIEYDIR